MTDLIDNVFDRFKFIPVVDLDKGTFGQRTTKACLRLVRAIVYDLVPGDAVLDRLVILEVRDNLSDPSLLVKRVTHRCQIVGLVAPTTDSIRISLNAFRARRAV